MPNDDPNSPPNTTPSTSPDTSPSRLSWPALAAPLLAVAAVILGCTGITTAVTGTLPPRTALFAVWAAPAVALTGTLLAGLSLRSTSRSPTQTNTPRVGKPVAVLGLFLSIAAAVLLGAVALMTAATLAGSSALAPEVARLITAAQDNRMTDARAALANSAKAGVSEQQLKWFTNELNARVGTINGASADMSIFDGSRQVLASSANAAAAEISVEEMPRPVWLETDSGRVIAYGWVDERALSLRQIKIRDLAIVTAANEAILLKQLGIAQQLADKLGWNTTAPPPDDQQDAHQDLQQDNQPEDQPNPQPDPPNTNDSP